MSVAFGLEQMQPRKFVIVIAISCGVALASYGEIAFDWQGFVCQALGIAFEAARLVCIQKLLTGLKMGPVRESSPSRLSRFLGIPRRTVRRVLSPIDHALRPDWDPDPCRTLAARLALLRALETRFDTGRQC